MSAVSPPRPPAAFGPREGTMSARVLRFVDGRRSAKEVASLAGVDPRHVYTIAERAGIAGAVRRVRPAAAPLVARVVLRDLRLSPEVTAWIAAQAVGGVTVQDVIRAILVDAFQDEVGL
jgi:hypothetical protein